MHIQWKQKLMGNMTVGKLVVLLNSLFSKVD